MPDTIEAKPKARGKSYTVQNVGDELSGALAIREALAEHDDPALILDCIEGQTNLHEAIYALYEEIARDTLPLAGIDKAIAEMQSRKARITASAEARENIILMAMERAGIQTIVGPAKTLTVKTTPATVIVTNEAEIPARFWKSPDPKLDKRAVNDAVKAGESVPGVEKSNGGVCLQIRGG